MLLTVTTTHRPATDLGYLLTKHPDNVHEAELPFGRATIFLPEASEARCTAALTLEIDPVELVRGKGRTPGQEDQYVSDRPMRPPRCCRWRWAECWASRPSTCWRAKARPIAAGTIFGTCRPRIASPPRTRT